jgi:hypothetical protein
MPQHWVRRQRILETDGADDAAQGGEQARGHASERVAAVEEVGEERVTDHGG